ncbi:MAG: MazG nucleotide pyrophosphohydrolase domain-containing protein, partial [Oscillospiraceae bacterium]
SNIEEEIGDVLFSAVNVSRMLSKNPEEALTKSCDKFISRFSFVENQGVNLKEADIDLLNELWQKSKMNSRGN